jgi:hypothetical protein
MHGMHLGSLNSVVASGEPSEAVPGDFSEAGLLDPVGAPEEFILEAVSYPCDLNQGKPRCITPFIFESLNICVMPVH